MGFYEEMLKEDFFEKKASDMKVKSVLETTDPDILTKLANEIDSYVAGETPTLEQKLAGEEEVPAEKKEELSTSTAVDKGVKEPAKEEEKTEEKKEAGDCGYEDKSEEKTDEKPEEKKEAEEETPAKTEEEKSEEKKEAGEETPTKADEETPAKKDETVEEVDEETVKQAYELAEQKLANSGYGVVDYVFSKCASEEVAYLITDKAEKLASLTDMPILQVADEIINSVIEKQAASRDDDTKTRVMRDRIGPGVSRLPKNMGAVLLGSAPGMALSAVGAKKMNLPMMAAGQALGSVGGLTAGGIVATKQRNKALGELSKKYDVNPTEQDKKVMDLAGVASMATGIPTNLHTPESLVQRLRREKQQKTASEMVDEAFEKIMAE